MAYGTARLTPAVPSKKAKVEDAFPPCDAMLN